MTKIRFVLALAAAATVGASVTSAAQPRDTQGRDTQGGNTQGIHYVDKLQYSNNGAAYNASVAYFFQNPGSDKVRRIGCIFIEANKGDPCKVKSGGKAVVVIADTEDFTPEEGAEVWLKINIEAGSSVSCQKKNAKFYYSPGSKTIAKFSTAGTTKNNNNCKYNGDK